MSSITSAGDFDLDEVLRVVEADRDRTEEDRRSTPEVVGALRAAGLFRLQCPTEVGGVELPPLEALRIFETLAAVDAARHGLCGTTQQRHWLVVS